jgi:putative phosphoribosyl transferase
MEQAQSKWPANGYDASRAQILIEVNYMNMFFDRHAAGISLAKKLGHYRGHNAIIYSLPKGGVPVAYEVAKALELPLDIVIVQKVTHPISRKFPICAVRENGQRMLDECGACGLDSDWLNNEYKLSLAEAARQRLIYKDGRESLSAENKIAIIIDDGIATGITMRAAIQTIQDQWPDQIVVATPVASHFVISELRELCDDLVVINNDHQFLGTVRSYYTDYPKVSDYEVRALLEDANRHLLPKKVAPLPATQRFILA